MSATGEEHCFPSLRWLARLWTRASLKPHPGLDRITVYATGPEAMCDWTNVADDDDFGPGEYRVVDVDDVDIAVFNLDGEYFAIEDVCTHDCGTRTGGCVENGRVVRPKYGAWFDIRTGNALTPPAYEPVATFPMRAEDGVVQVPAE